MLCFGGGGAFLVCVVFFCFLVCLFLFGYFVVGLVWLCDCLFSRIKIRFIDWKCSRSPLRPLKTRLTF